ncbi:hypothetical protein CEF21_05715 [Bacillus sp. FJAT-42376]|uniref:hypothetical protein n=1 Tax=Bacillus sp. FJAT-42376 TaxID=2014076 RepID=UPI000F4DB325|nr:hypothetical protein [Bacillus sp. FJAT-42376]AZB41840.1 hypothetical protein CEF21_05715 [Bacillus sp. FJAT-42376]
MRKYSKLNVDQLNVHPLRIPEGWTVNYNSFLEFDPLALNEEDDRWYLMSESLLQLNHSKKSIMVDLGWYPDTSVEGNFSVDIIKNEDWENPLDSYETKDYREVIRFIESTLKNITETQDI